MSTNIETGKLAATLNKQVTSSTNRAADRPGQGTAGAQKLADTVSMTESAAMLLAGEKALQSIPAVDKQRVAEVRQALADGSFRIDAGRIADRIIELESGNSKKI